MKLGVRIAMERLDDVRPLVVPVRPAVGESLAGLVARSTRRNVLRHPRIILNEVGIAAISTGTIGIDVEGLEDRLADKIGCTVAEISTRATIFVPGSSNKEVGWGGTTMSRFDLDLENRWIAPITLRQADFHLAAWSCRLLPFCPISLERLISRCPGCGERLRWISAWGIGTCEHCRQVIPSSGEEPLASGLVPGYRAFAGLVSVDHDQRAAARSHLSADIAALSTPALIRLIVGLGRKCRAEQDLEPNIGRLEPRQLAEIVSIGAELVHDFPNRFRTAVRSEIERIGWDDRVRLRPLLTGLRRLGADNLDRPEQRRLIRGAIPEVFETSERALGGLRAPVMLLRDIQRLTNLKTSQMRPILDAKALKFTAVGTGGRSAIQFDRADAENFIRRLNSSAMSSVVEAAFGVPRYAVEQLLCLDELEQESHPAIALLRKGLRVSGHADYLIQFDHAARSDERDSRAIPLFRAVRRIGGRAKPWGAILKALRTKAIPFWLAEANPRYRRSAHFSLRALVLPEDVARFDDMMFDEEDFQHANFFADSVSQLDACDLLNVDSRQISEIAAAGGLKFDQGAGVHLASKSEVIALSTVMISAAEISLRANIHPTSLAKCMAKRSDIPRRYVGWSRPEVERELPSFHPADTRSGSERKRRRSAEG